MSADYAGSCEASRRRAACGRLVQCRRYDSSVWTSTRRASRSRSPDSDGSAPETVATIPNETKLLIKRLKALGQLALLRCCYEAGPTGFALHRSLRDAGIDCIVIAPSLVPKRAGDRVKTDRRDAVKLARFLRSGDLTEVHVPEASTEAMRDLERSRDDAKRAERTSRHQLSKFLLRHGRRYEGKTAWTGMHLDWARGQAFAHEALNRVLVDYVQAVENATARVDRLTQDIAELVETWSQRPLVKALQALRGVQLVTAVILAAELGDFERFPSAPAPMAYLGLVPSEHSSGETRRRGRITRTGNGHVRRVLIESAWAYRYRPTNHELGDPQTQRGRRARSPGHRMESAAPLERQVQEAFGSRQEQAANGHCPRARARGLRLEHRASRAPSRGLSFPSTINPMTVKPTSDHGSGKGNPRQHPGNSSPEPDARS
jgi:transposase